VTFTIIDAPQRSPDWYAARVGRLTGSRADDMLAMTKKGEEGAPRRNLRVQLVIERITGQPMDDGYQSARMRRGLELEATARQRYEAATGYLVRRTGFLAAHALPVGCSIDGDINEFQGVVEFKCPDSATHYANLMTLTPPDNYTGQLLHNAWISGAKWVDFVSFDDRFPPGLDLVIRRYIPTEFDVAIYARNATNFLDIVAKETQQLRDLMAREDQVGGLGA
jgi:hypothetical protein